MEICVRFVFTPSFDVRYVHVVVEKRAGLLWCCHGNSGGGWQLLGYVNGGAVFISCVCLCNSMLIFSILSLFRGSILIFFFTNWLQYCMLLFNFFIFNNQIVINLKKKNNFKFIHMYMYNPCVEMDNILGMEVGNSYNGLYIHHFNLQEKCLVLVVLDLNVYCWLTEAVSAHFIDMDVPFCKGVQLWNRYI